MKKILLFCLIISCMSPNIINAQHKPKLIDEAINKNQIGIQLNPFIDEFLFNGLALQAIYSIRYGYKVYKPLLIGAEFCGNIPYLLNGIEYKSYTYNIGIYTRYSIPTESRIRGFVEASPYYSHSYYQEVIGRPELKTDKFGLYLAPGVSFFSRNKKVSVDLYYKFSSLDIIDNKKAVFSYKFNFHF